MEQFLRNYYTNLNPNATEEDILAFLASQGFGGMGDFTNQGSTGTGGITDLRQQMFQRQQQNFKMEQDDGGISNVFTGPRGSFGKPPSTLQSFLVGLVAPPVGVAMQLRNLASKGKLPFGLNEAFGDEYTGSGVNIKGLEAGIQSNIDDDSQEGISSFDAAVAAGIQAAEDDSDPGDIGSYDPTDRS